MHEGVETLGGVFLPFVGEVEVEHGGFELGMPQVALDEPRIDAGFQQMGGIRMALMPHAALDMRILWGAPRQRAPALGCHIRWGLHIELA